MKRKADESDIGSALVRVGAPGRFWGTSPFNPDVVALGGNWIEDALRQPLLEAPSVARGGGATSAPSNEEMVGTPLGEAASRVVRSLGNDGVYERPRFLN